MEKKQDEIEEAYTHYLEEQQEANEQEDFDFTKGMRQYSLQ